MNLPVPRTKASVPHTSGALTSHVGLRVRAFGRPRLRKLNKLLGRREPLGRRVVIDYYTANGYQGSVTVYPGDEVSLHIEHAITPPQAAVTFTPYAHTDEVRDVARYGELP